LALKMEETCSSETSVDYQITRHYIQEDRTCYFYASSHTQDVKTELAGTVRISANTELLFSSL
jgi:hypothetical protein